MSLTIDATLVDVAFLLDKERTAAALGRYAHLHSFSLLAMQ